MKETMSWTRNGWFLFCLMYVSVVDIEVLLSWKVLSIAQVFRRDSPPTRSRSEGSGGESSSMLTSAEGNAVQGRMLLWLKLRRLLALKANEWLIFTNGPGQPLCSFSWTVTCKYPSCI
jgi:hypothetical protein